MLRMNTLREAVSRVRSMNKFLSSDNQITDRAIAAELRSKASLLIKRETNQRKLWQSPNLFTALDCIEMIKVPLAECCDYKSPCSVRRSKIELPSIAEGIFGLLIQGVYNVDTSKSFKFTTPNRYSNILKLELPGRQGYYWFHKGFLYVSDEHVERISVHAYFESDFNEYEYNACICDDGEPECYPNPLDKEFKCPSYLMDSVIAMTHDVIAKIYIQRQEDETPNNKDDSK